LIDEGKTVVLVGSEEAIIAMRDEIRPQAKDVISKLHRMGIKVLMLSGDNAITANAVAKELNIDVRFSI